WWQDPFGLFTSDQASTTTSTVTAQTRTSPTPKGSPKPTRDPKGIEIVTDQLHPELANNKSTPLDGIGRNIFVYPTPTPPPTPKPLPPTPTPTPLPIIIVGLNPTGVIARTGDFTLAVNVVKSPEDARIFLDGRELKTTRLDESHLTTQVTTAMIQR